MKQKESPIGSAGSRAAAALILAVALAALSRMPGSALTPTAHAEEAIEFVYPAGRNSFVSGEEVRLWLRLPSHSAGTGELTLGTSNGPIVALEEEVRDSKFDATLSYSIDSALLCPGSYELEFRLNESVCKSTFTVVNAVPATHFPIGVAGPPRDATQAANYRELGFNTVLVTDPDKLNTDALARCGVRWLRQLTVKPESSPADPQTVDAGGRHVQLAAQTTRGAWGFSGIAIEELPPLPGTTETVDVIDGFNEDAERQRAAMALLMVVSGQTMEAAANLVKLKPSPARTLFAERLKQLLLAERFDRTLQPEVRRIEKAIAQKQEINVPNEVRSLLDARNMPVYKQRLANPFADDHTIVAYRSRYGLRPPPWWEGNRNADSWRQFLDFRAGLWPSALDVWSRSLGAVDPGFLFLTGTHGQAAAEMSSSPALSICYVAGSPLGELQPLFEAAPVAGRSAHCKLWVVPDAPRMHVRRIRHAVLTSLASGASGIVYQPQSAHPAEDFTRAAEVASLNGTITRYGDFLLSLARKPGKVAVLDSRMALYRSLGEEPLETKGRSTYPSRVAAAWAQCARVGSVPDIIQDDDIAGGLGQYSVVLAPGLRELSETMAPALREFAAAGGALIVDKSCESAIEGAIRLPFAFGSPSEKGDGPRQDMEQLRMHLARFAPQEITSSDDDFLITEFVSPPGSRVFCVLRLSGGPGTRSTEITLPRGAPCVYDVFAGVEARIVPPNEDKGFPTIRVTAAAGQAKLFAVLPARIGSVSVDEPAVKDTELALTATIADEQGAPVRSPVPAAVLVLDESGAERFRVYRLFAGGKLSINFPIAVNEPPGRWFVRITELYSRRSHGAPFAMPQRKPVDVIAPAPAASVFHGKQCADLLKRARSLVLVSGAGASRETADLLARGLQRFAINCDRKQDTETLRENDFALSGDAILLGSPKDNLLINHLHKRGLVPVEIRDSDLGHGSALVFWTQSAFRLGVQTITICSNDADGLGRGAEALLDICSGRDPTVSRSAKARTLGAAPPEMLPPPQAQPAVFSFRLDDSVTSVAAPASGRFVIAGALSGDLYTVTARGEGVWRAHLDSAIQQVYLPGRGSDPLVVCEDAATLFSVVSTQQWRFPIPEADEGETLAKTSISFDGSRVFLGTSVGKVFALDNSGNLKWQARLAGPIGALSCSGGRAAAADDSAIVLFTERGARAWEKGFAGCSCLTFSADDRSLIAGSQSGVVRRFALSDGRLTWERTLGAAIKGVVRMPDGTTFVLAENGAAVRAKQADKDVVDLSVGHNIHIVAAAADCSYVGAASLGGTVSIFDSSAELLRRFSVPDACISSLAVAADAKILIAGDQAGIVRVFRIE